MANGRQQVDDWQDVSPSGADDWQDVSGGGLSSADVGALTTRTGPSESRSAHSAPKPGFWDELNQQIGPAAWANTWQRLKQSPLKTLGGMAGRAMTIAGGIEPVPSGTGDPRDATLWGDPNVEAAQGMVNRGPKAVAAGLVAGGLQAGLAKTLPAAAETIGDAVPVGRMMRAAGAAGEKLADRIPVVGGVLPAARAAAKSWRESAPPVEGAAEATPKPAPRAPAAKPGPPMPRPEDLSTTGGPQTLSPNAPASAPKPAPGMPPPPPAGFQFGVPESQVPPGMGVAEGSSLAPPNASPRSLPTRQPAGSVPLNPPPPEPGPGGFGLGSGDSTNPPSGGPGGAPPSSPPPGSMPLRAPAGPSMPPGFGVAQGDSLNAPAGQPGQPLNSPPPSMTPLGSLPTKAKVTPKVNGKIPAEVSESPASPPPTAASPTVPESGETIQAQLEQLASGDRRAVMLPKGTPPPTVRPPGTRAFRDVHGNVYIYDPEAITTAEIRAAAANNELPNVLGAAKGGLGAPDKSALQGPPAAVVGRSANGTEVQATATDQANLPQTVEQTSKVTPADGSVSVENPEEVLGEREASVRGPRDQAALEERPNWQDRPTQARVAQAQPGDRFAPPDHLVWRGEGQAPYEGRPLVVEQVNRKTGAVSATVPGRPELGPVKLSAKDLANWEVRQTPIFRNEARALAANSGIPLEEAESQLTQTHGRPVSDHPLGRLPGEGSYLQSMGYKLTQAKPKSAPTSPPPPAPSEPIAAEAPKSPSDLPSTMSSADVDQWIRESGLSPSQALFELIKSGIRVTGPNGKPIF